jgi:negative regulator of sigma E activity
MAFRREFRVARGVVVLVLLCAPVLRAQEPSAAQVIARIDAAVQYRYEHVLGFTDIEHYAVFRGQDETHPVAEMTVKTTYRKGVGKSYEVLKESGSVLLLKLGLHPLLDNEREVNLPGNVEQSWFNSANYAMELKPGGVQRIDGRDCYALAVRARRKATNAIDGTLWVEAQSGMIVRLDGVATKSPSPLTGASHMMREYMNLNGFPMAAHARAESTSLLLGRTVVKIDYGSYQIEATAGAR